MVRVHLTTPDRRFALSDRGTVPFAEPTDDAVVAVTVDPAYRYQTMEGFGAALTESSAAVLHRLQPPIRDQVMASLFDPGSGLGLSWLRQPVGASDFVTDHHYTYDDLPPGRTDHTMRHFSVARDERHILPLLRQARRLNPQLSVMASPWSPPAWMKTNRDLVGGRLVDEPRIYRAYARYLVRFVQSYMDAGVPVHALTVQNEPHNGTPDGYPGTDMPVAQQRKVIEALGPALRRAGLDTKILAFDHNWATAHDHAEVLLTDCAVARWISGIAFHCYDGDPAAQSRIHDRYPNLNVYLTECSGIRSDNPAATFADTLAWHSRNVVIGATRRWASAVLTWNLALDPDGGPHLGGCDRCTGLLTVGSGQEVHTNAEYHTLGHLSRFVRPGARRVASSPSSTVAFTNPDSSLVLVVHNDSAEPRTIAVTCEGRTFVYRLPPGALATFTW
jgi:glucosylceramidase